MASLKVQRIRDEISTSTVTSNPQISGLFQAPLGLNQYSKYKTD